MAARSEASRTTPHLHLQQLQHFVEVARSPTWTEAAKRLHLSQSALSQSLAEMERRLGVRLFERAGRRRPLSAEGQELLWRIDGLDLHLFPGSQTKRELDIVRAAKGKIIINSPTWLASFKDYAAIQKELEGILRQK